MKKILLFALALCIAVPVRANETLPAMEEIRHEMRMMQRQTLRIVAFAAGTGFAVWAFRKYKDKMDEDDGSNSPSGSLQSRYSLAIGIGSAVAAVTGLGFAINPDGVFGQSSDQSLAVRKKISGYGEPHESHESEKEIHDEERDESPVRRDRTALRM